MVRWRMEKFKPKAGPGGGDGGNGGHVYAIATRDLSYLEYYRHKKSFQAQNGQSGASQGKHGANGDDLVLTVPRGSILTNTDTGDTFEITSDTEKVLILKGGCGGYGNEHFKSSTNTTPYESTPGKEGERGNLSY